MCDFRIIRHDDYHGDAMLFSVVDEDGNELRRVPSEAEAIEWALYLEAWVENEERDAYLEAGQKRRARRGGVIIEGPVIANGWRLFRFDPWRRSRRKTKPSAPQSQGEVKWT